MSSADFNPYASPQAPGVAIPPLPPQSYDEALFRRRVRIAVACLAPLALANWWFVANLPGVPRTTVLMNIFWIAPVLVAMFAAGDRILTLLGTAAHVVFGGNVPLPVWLAVARAALWMLPWVGFLAAMIWAVFLLGLSLGSPIVHLCPLFGNLLAAWCYVPLAYRWWQTRRHYAALAEVM